MNIIYKKRGSDELFTEKIAGENYLRWSCESVSGKLFTRLLGKQKFFSVVIGKYQDMRFSRRQTADFVREMEINLDEALRENLEEYHSFNDFFTRKLKPESRPVSPDPGHLAAPADGRLLAYASIESGQLFQIKGKQFSIASLLRDQKLAYRFEGGPAVVVRLNPSDYHRFHFRQTVLPVKPAVSMAIITRLIRFRFK
jgi:phosphatidylserine decarboxylase